MFSLSGSCVFDSPGFHCEFVGLIGDASLQTRAVHAHTSRVTAFSDGHTERTFGHWGAVVADLHAVGT